jgi:hypothetical protein
MRLGAVVPPEKLVQGHRLHCRLGHGASYTIGEAAAIAGLRAPRDARASKKITLSRAGGTG